MDIRNLQIRQFFFHTPMFPLKNLILRNSHQLVQFGRFHAFIITTDLFKFVFPPTVILVELMRLIIISHSLNTAWIKISPILRSLKCFSCRKRIMESWCPCQFKAPKENNSKPRWNDRRAGMERSAATKLTWHQWASRQHYKASSELNQSEIGTRPPIWWVIMSALQLWLIVWEVS